MKANDIVLIHCGPQNIIFRNTDILAIRFLIFKIICMSTLKGKTAKSGTLWCDKEDLSKEAKAKVGIACNFKLMITLSDILPPSFLCFLPSA